MGALHHLTKIKRVPFWLWYANHEFMHIFIGLAYAWLLREVWGEFSVRYILLAVVGSVIIDIDHLFYFFFYGRKEGYSAEVRQFLRQGQLGSLIKFWKENHKHNTGLASHNVYMLGFFVLLSILSFGFDWKSRMIFFGAIVLHLIFDIFDDFWELGYMNENWKRLGRKKDQ